MQYGACNEIILFDSWLFSTPTPVISRMGGTNERWALSSLAVDLYVYPNQLSTVSKFER